MTAKTTSPNGRSFIKGFESTKLDAYMCSARVWTIGTGTTVYPNGIKVKRGDKCTQAQADQYFSHDLIKFEKAVNELVKVTTTQNQFDALVSFAYNVGVGALSDSTLLKALNGGFYKAAAAQFLRWNKAGGKVVAGLTRRRKAEMELFTK